MKYYHYFILAGVCFFLILLLIPQEKSTGSYQHIIVAGERVVRIAPTNLYPDSVKTPGKADTLDFSALTRTYSGQTYSQYHRSVSSSEKKNVCAEYTENCKGVVEIDHFYPLCAGGSNDITNLWAEPEHITWNGKDFGFHTKDKLEAYLCIHIKKGDIDPHIAFQKLTSDWVKYYQELGL